MGNRDNWSYIQIPKVVFEQVESMLKVDEFTKKGIIKPKDIALILFRDFIEHGSDMLDSISKVKRLEIELKSINNMLEMIKQNKGDDHEILNNIKHKQTKNKITILIDKNINKEIEVIHKNNIPYCTHDKTYRCIHTLYLLMLKNFINLEKYKD